jgi:hypothetical protein
MKNELLIIVYTKLVYGVFLIGVQIWHAPCFNIAHTGIVEFAKLGSVLNTIPESPGFH